MIGFSTFLLGCVDFSRIRPDGASRLGDIVIERCVSRFSGFTFLFFVLFTAFYLWRIVAFIFGVRRLVDMYNFYTHLLRIPDADVGTISWPEVVKRIAAIRNENPATAISSKSAQSADASLDAHDIANRIMRQENYLIALFNKEVLDLRVPVPTSLQRFLGPADAESKGKMLTRALEWNLRFCLMEFLFDPQGRVRKVFLKSKNRNILIQSLRRRFIFMGVLNAVFAPFIVLYVLMYSFFRYFEVIKPPIFMMMLLKISIIRNFTKTHQPLGGANTPYLRNGNLENLTNSHIFSAVALTKAIQALQCT